MTAVKVGDREFPEQGMSFREFIQHVIPGLDDNEAHQVLWECTPFPLAQGRDDLMPYIVAVRERLAAGQTLEEVLEEISEEISEEMTLVAAEDAETRAVTDGLPVDDDPP